MKKLGKLIINPEKVIKKEELVNLRGGYFFCADYSYCVCCHVSAQGGLTLCDDDSSHLLAWCDFWYTFGTPCSCERAYWT